jgi:hypothetical protein
LPLNKKCPPGGGHFGACLATGSSFVNEYVVCLKPLVALHGNKLDLLALFQGAVTGGVDFGKVYKVLFAILARDKTIPFGGIEPLDSANLTLCHFENTPSNVKNEYFSAERTATALAGVPIRLPQRGAFYHKWDKLLIIKR